MLHYSVYERQRNRINKSVYDPNNLDIAQRRRLYECYERRQSYSNPCLPIQLEEVASTRIQLVRHLHTRSLFQGIQTDQTARHQPQKPTVSHNPSWQSVHEKDHLSFCYRVLYSWIDKRMANRITFLWASSWSTQTQLICIDLELLETWSDLWICDQFKNGHHYRRVSSFLRKWRTCDG